MRNPERQLKFYKLAFFLLLGLVLAGFLLYKQDPSRFCPNPNADLAQKAKPSAETKLEKTFELTAKKNTKDKYKINIFKADKVKMVTMKNQPVLAKEGEEFLLVYLEIENNLETPVTVDSQNYFRLTDTQGRKLAPDFFNGPIQVSPISTKKDQIGFVIKSEQKEFKLLVGEIEGDKETVEFKFD